MDIENVMQNLIDQIYEEKSHTELDFLNKKVDLIVPLAEQLIECKRLKFDIAVAQAEENRREEGRKTFEKLMSVQEDMKDMEEDYDI